MRLKDPDLGLAADVGVCSLDEAAAARSRLELLGDHDSISGSTREGVVPREPFEMDVVEAGRVPWPGLATKRDTSCRLRSVAGPVSVHLACAGGLGRLRGPLRGEHGFAGSRGAQGDHEDG